MKLAERKLRKCDRLIVIFDWNEDVFTFILCIKFVACFNQWVNWVNGWTESKWMRALNQCVNTWPPSTYWPAKQSQICKFYCQLLYNNNNDKFSLKHVNRTLCVRLKRHFSMQSRMEQYPNSVQWAIWWRCRRYNTLKMCGICF